MKFNRNVIQGDISFSTPKFKNILVIKETGEFFVKGKKVIEDLEVYEALKEFLGEMSFLKPKSDLERK